jgi:hypothetical protein
MKILRHADLDASRLERPFERTVALLEAGDFRGAEVKKLAGRPLYRAKLSDADRLIFRFGAYRGETYLILLEVVRNHDYGSSRFLRGAVVDESRLVPLHQPAPLTDADVQPLGYVNPRQSRVHVLDKVLSFDDAQEVALNHRPPLILIGSAGSGKTVLTIQKLRQLPGEILYVTRSPFLVDNGRRLYYAEGYENDDQDVAFLSFLEFVHSVAIPEGTPLTFADFAAWFARHRAGSPVKDAHALFEEFHGVLTGAVSDRPHLSLDDYLALGIRRSIFAEAERPGVYALFLKYLAFLKETNRYDLNLVCFDLHARCRPTYDFVVADEVQDLTAVQLSLILKSLRHGDQFVLCGDSNQIVHPNFFSWATVKTFFHTREADGNREVTRILTTNYRNSPEVSALANRLLLVKNARFGSIDRESHYLVQSVAETKGVVELLPDTDAVRREIDVKTGRSARVALLVLRDEDKADAVRVFRTPLVFSVQEAKGLEYETVVLLNFVSGQSRAFADVADGVTVADLRGDFVYARAKDKTDRSLEAYKFFVNALYVAMTRAVRNLYVLERTTSHPLLTLLGLMPGGGAANVKAEQSSEEEWKEEARRLEAQGKAEQAEAIRKTILHTEPVPWTVVTPETVDALTERVRGAIVPDPKASQLLLDYAVTFASPVPLAILQGLRFRPALHPEQALNEAKQRHSQDYHQRGYRDLLRKVARHGVDFRDPLNRTPLMMATQLGLAPLVAQLVAEGASLHARDNWGRIPLQIALREAYGNRFYAKSSLGPICDEVAPAALDVQVAGRLVRIDRHRMEFFLLHTMLALFETILRCKIRTSIPAFEAGDFLPPLEHFPENVIPARRRRRDAISAALAKNEVFRAGPGSNRRLFVRVRHGFYIPNPCMRLAVGDEWCSARELVHLDALAEEPEGRLRPLVRTFDMAAAEITRVFERERTAEAETSTPADTHAGADAAATAPATPVPAAPPSSMDGAPSRPSAATVRRSSGSPRTPRASAPCKSRTVIQRLRESMADAATEARAIQHGLRLLAEEGEGRKAIVALGRGRPLAAPEEEKWIEDHADDAACMMLAVLRSFIEESEEAPAETLVPLRCALRLAGWGDERLLPILLRLGSVPSAVSLFRDCGAENLGRIIASVARGRGGVSSLSGLALDDHADPWVREGALHALVVLALHDPAICSRLACLGVVEKLLDRCGTLPKKDRPVTLVQRALRTTQLLHPGESLRFLLDADERGLLPREPDPLSFRRLMRRAEAPVSDVLDASRAETPGFIGAPADEARHFPCLRPPAVAVQPGMPPLSSKVPDGLHRRFEAGTHGPESLAAWGPREPLPGPAALNSIMGDSGMDGATTVGRNAPCPCGSGKKYKKCCGR